MVRNRQTERRTDGWTEGWTNRWTDGRMDGRTNGMDGWRQRRMDRWIDRQMDEWTDILIVGHVWAKKEKGKIKSKDSTKKKEFWVDLKQIKKEEKQMQGKFIFI